MKKIGLILFILLISCSTQNQTNSKKIDRIITKMGIVETGKFYIQSRIEYLGYQTNEKDIPQLKKMETELTNEKIHELMKAAFREQFTDKEIDEINDFVTSSAFDKLQQYTLQNTLINKSFEPYLEELTRLQDSIEIALDNNTPIENTFSPIPVDRKNGFYKALKYDRNEPAKIVLAENPVLNFENVAEAKLDISGYTGEEGINFTFTEQGAQILFEFSKENVGEPLVLVVDKYIISIPIINEPIAGGSMRLSGASIDQNTLQSIEKELSN